MAAGALLAGPLSAFLPMSSSLSGASLPAIPGTSFAVVGGPVGASKTLVLPAGPGVTKASVRFPGHDSVWFERVHVIPGTVDLAFVLSEQEVTVEVYNAHRYASRTLTALGVTGSAGLEVDNPDTLPKVYPSTRSQVYVVRALGQGDARIENLVVWTFAGVPTPETTLEVVGSRLVPWPFMADDGQAMVEGYGYLTDIMTAEDNSEQRVQLREVPKRTLDLGFVLDEREAQHAGALLYGFQYRGFGVPLWFYANRLLSTLSPGGTVITVDTADIPWAAGDVVFLWTSAFSWEALTVESVGVGSITTTTPASGSWPAFTTLVVPMGVGRLSTEEPLGWESLRVGSARLRFDMEAVR